MENQTTENMDIQEYADAHCGGDRLRAIHSILCSDEKIPFDPYVDSLTKDEANFTFLLVCKHAIIHYGGEKSYQKALRCYSTLSSLGLEEEDLKKPNPFVKPLLKHLAFLACAVFIPVVAQLFLTDVSWLTSLLSLLRFNKVKKFFASLPARTDDTPVKVSFDEVLEQYNEYLRSKTTPEVAEKALQQSKKANISALIWLPAFSLLNLVSMFASYANVIAGSVCCTLIPAFFMWKIPRAFRAVRRGKEAVDGLPDGGQAVQTPMEKRQQGCALGMFGVALLYLLGGLFSIAISISFMTS